MSRHLATWIAVVIAFLEGCTATIVRSPKDGGPVHGKILSNDATKMYVETPSGEVGVFHTDIESIDHPGNVAAVVGGLLTLYGLYNVRVGLPQCEEKGAAFCTGVVAPAATGIPLFVGGLIVYSSSVSAAQNGAPKGFDARLLILPAGAADGRLAQGAAVVVGGRF